MGLIKAGLFAVGNGGIGIGEARSGFGSSVDFDCRFGSSEDLDCRFGSSVKLNCIAN